MTTTDKKEILDAINILTLDVSTIKSELSNVKTDVSIVKSELDDVKSIISTLIETVQDFAQNTQNRFLSMDERFDRLEIRMNRTEAVMVTKEYLDDKLADLRSDLGLTDRNTNVKIHSLTDELVEEKSLKPVVGKTIKSLPPFANAK